MIAINDMRFFALLAIKTQTRGTGDIFSCNFSFELSFKNKMPILFECDILYIQNIAKEIPSNISIQLKKYNINYLFKYKNKSKMYDCNNND